jgi:hypothetical protein
MFKFKKQNDAHEGVWFKKNWISFYPKFCNARITIDTAGYFDERPVLICTLTTLLSFVALLVSPFFGWIFALVSLAVFLFIPWGECFIHLPIKTGKDQCENPGYGFYFYRDGRKIPDQFWIRRGKKSTVIELPWYLTFYRKSILMKDNTWVTECGRKDKKFKNPTVKEHIKVYTTDYMYTLKNGEVQNVLATVVVDEMEWRPKWFRWTSLFSKVRKSIDITFSEQVGEGAGSWKGGVLGCSYEMLGQENALGTLMRMQENRKFN